MLRGPMARWVREYDYLAVLKKYINRVRHVHLKDVRPDVIQKVKDEHLSFLQGVRLGTFTVPGDGAIDYESAAAWRALIEKHGLSYIAWSLSNRDESAALIRADCAKTAGWTDGDLTETGRWLRDALRADRDKA